MVALLFALILLTSLLAPPPASAPSDPLAFAVRQRLSFMPPAALPSGLDVARRAWFDEEADAEPAGRALASRLEFAAGDAANARRRTALAAADDKAEYPHAPLVYTLCNILR